MFANILLFLMPTFPFTTSQHPVIPYASLYINKTCMHLILCIFPARLVILMRHAVLTELTFAFSILYPRLLAYILLFLMPTFPFTTIPYAGLYINKSCMHLILCFSCKTGYPIASCSFHWTHLRILGKHTNHTHASFSAKRTCLVFTFKHRACRAVQTYSTFKRICTDI